MAPNLEYGFWSRFNPLSSIGQVDPIGIFDSDCYNLHNVVEQKTERSNFLYYDCLDYQTKSIKKIIQFLDENENLDINQYKNYWYLFFVSVRPLQKKFQLLQYEILLYKTVDVLVPFYDQKLVFTFGGGLSIIPQQRIDTWNGNLEFSYFPGAMRVSLIYYYTFDIELDTYDFVYVIQQNQDQSECLKSMKEQFEDENIKFIDIKQRTTQASNFDAFIFSGWIKLLKQLKWIQIFKINHQNFCQYRK